MSSSSSICEISRSKRRYHEQDLLLQAFIGHSGFTAKEVAVEVLDWCYEPYANSPKRAYDLYRLGYLDMLDSRECRKTKKPAHTFAITEKGLAHLRKQNLVNHVIPAKPSDEQVNSINAKKQLGDLKSLLRG